MTFFSDEFGEAFHSRAGAKTEAFAKFAQATHLPQLAQRTSLRLLDVCYGLGYNTAAALELVWQINPTCCIEVYGLEIDLSVPKAAIAPEFLSSWSLDVQTVLKTLAQAQIYESDRLQASLWIGDARHTIQSVIETGFQADAIFFDPFSPRRCPQLWTVEFFAQVARCLAPEGTLATYSRSASVRSAMQAVGFHIGSIPLGETHLPHEWSQGTVARWSANHLPPLSQMEQEHLQTRAAIPYRDPHLNDEAIAILARHQQEQSDSTRESTSSWRRRWGIR